MCVMTDYPRVNREASERVSGYSGHSTLAGRTAISQPHSSLAEHRSAAFCFRRCRWLPPSNEARHRHLAGFSSSAVLISLRPFVEAVNEVGYLRNCITSAQRLLLLWPPNRQAIIFCSCGFYLLLMTALRSIRGHYIFVLWFLLSSFSFFLA